MKPILVLLNPKNLLAHCLIIQHNLDTICICSPLREVSVLTPHAISAHLELYKTHQSVVGPSVLVLSLTITKILIFYLFLPGCDFFFNPAAENICCSMSGSCNGSNSNSAIISSHCACCGLSHDTHEWLPRHSCYFCVYINIDGKCEIAQTMQ